MGSDFVKVMFVRMVLTGVCSFAIAGSAVIAEDGVEDDANIPTAAQAEDGIVTYTLDFFEQYFPVTALDLVNRVPGFTIDRGGDVRGFGGAAGNVLIDGKRPSTKSDNIEDLLSRIGKDNVERVDLIRGATGGLDLGGQQSVAVNVIRKEGGSASIPWELDFAATRGGFEPRANVAYSNEINRTNYTIGVERRGFVFEDVGFENLINSAESDEFRDEVEDGRFSRWSLDIKTETNFDNGDIFRLNFRGDRRRFDGGEESIRTPENQDFSNLFLQIRDNSNDQIEVSSDYEHDFSSNFAVKVIGLVNRQFRENLSTLDIDNAIAEDALSQSISDTTEGETIGRLEFDWNGWNNHAVQFGGEVAQNFIDSGFQLFSGGVEVPLPGSNTRVSELRGEPFLSDSWSLNSKLTADLSLAIEISKIQQTGDVENSRTFVFQKASGGFDLSKKSGN
jgi:hypothetical protein